MTGLINIYFINLIAGAGYAIIIVNVICTTYYNIILSYPLLFLANCFQSELPWVDCDNEWNTENCVKVCNSKRVENLNLIEHLFNINDW